MWATLRATPRATYGMLLAHAGIGIFVLGVTLVKGYESTSEVRMRTGDTATLDGYTFRFLGVEKETGPNYLASRATLEVTQGSNKIDTLHPAKRVYTVQSMPMTESDIYTGVFRDLYVALGDQVGMGEWVVRIQHKPMVNWIWGGCLFIAFGGLLAASDRRYRLPLTPSSQR